jgi:hypothetical protein
MDIVNNDFIKPDPKMARQFLDLLDETDTSFTFVIIEEPKPKDRMANVAAYYGTIEQYQDVFSKANKNGYAVFVTINVTNSKERTKANIERVRALFVDLDGSPIDPVYNAPLKAHIVVESSPGRYHAYWLVNDVPLDMFEAAQQMLIRQFNGDHSVCDLPRLMRLPGFVHKKNVPFQSRIIEISRRPPYTFQKFQEAFGSIPSVPRLSEQSSSLLESAVLVKLRERGLLKTTGKADSGRWLMRCPWASEHTDGSEEAFYYSKLSKEYPNEGFQCFHAHCKYRDIRTLRSFLGLPPTENVLPLFREIPPSSEYPVDALGSILGKAAKELFATVKAPVAVIAQSLLGAASLVSQGYADVATIDGRRIALSLFLITIAESGERKSAVDDIVLAPILDKQKSLCSIYREKLDQWQEAKKKEDRVGASFEKARERPIMPIIIVEEPTYEGLIKHLEYGQPSVGLFSDEGGRFLGGNAMNKDNMLKTLSGLSSLWDAKKDKPITRIRSGDSSLALYGRRCAFHLMIQESVYNKLNECSICDTQGFLPRCLISFPESMAGKRTYVDCDPRTLPGVIAFKKRCNDILSGNYPFACPAASQNQLEPIPIPLSKEAHNLYVEFHNSHEKRLGKQEDLYEIRRFGSKAAEHLLRLAGVLAFFENPSVIEISADYIERGAVIMDYYLNERLRLKNCYFVDPILVIAQKVLDWAKARGKLGVLLSELYQYGPSEVRSKDKALAVLSKLEEHGRAFTVPSSELNEKAIGKAWKFVWDADE